MNLLLKDYVFTSLINKLGDNNPIHSVKRYLLDCIYFISSEMMMRTHSISISYDLIIQPRTYNKLPEIIDNVTIAFLSLGHRRRYSMMRLIGCRLGTKNIKVESGA